MKLPYIDSCCCGCDLRSASLIIGWINLIFYILCVLWNLQPAIDLSDSSLSNYSDALNVYLSLLLFVSGLVMSIILLRGVYQGKAGYLNGWVIIRAFTSIIVFLVFIFYGSFLVSQDDTHHDIEFGIIIITVTVFWSLYATCSILVVHNYKRQLLGTRKEENQFMYKDIV